MRYVMLLGIFHIHKFEYVATDKPLRCDSGVAQNSITLIIGRAIAGLGGAGVTGGIYTIMAFIVPPARVPTYIGLIGAIFSLANVAGPLLGGVFTGEVTWRWWYVPSCPEFPLLQLLSAHLKVLCNSFYINLLDRDPNLQATDGCGSICIHLLVCTTNHPLIYHLVTSSSAVWVCIRLS